MTGDGRDLLVRAAAAHGSGDHAAAFNAYAALLRVAPWEPDPYHGLGLLAAQSGDHGRAQRLIGSAIVLAPDAAVYALNLGLNLRASGRPSDAERFLRRAATLNPGDPRGQMAAALAAAVKGRIAEARRRFRSALALSPDFLEGWSGKGELEFDDRATDACTALGRAAALAPFVPAVLGNWANALVRLGDYDRAVHVFDRALLLRRPPFLPTRPDAGIDDWTSSTKLRHDAEQYEYLIERGVARATDFAPIVANYRAAATAMEAEGQAPRPLPAVWRSRLMTTHGRVIHRAHGLERRHDVLSPAFDAAAAEGEYLAAAPRLAVVDDLLSADCLAALQRHCLESTMWFDVRHPPGYLGAMMSDGLACPVLLQVAEALRTRMPRMFGRSMLTQMWAFKYESRHAGTALHADAARVNVNFWITPDDANLSPGRSGLVIWNRIAPPEWNFDVYNNDQTAIRRFLDDSGAQSITVPYRCNRAVIFDSDLFHRTDDFVFADDYRSRRINLTMLFGRRGTHDDQ